MMRFLIELSGEHETLPRAEAMACLESITKDISDIKQDNGYLSVTSTTKPEILAARLSMSHYVNEEMSSGTFEDVLACAERTDLHGATFMVRAPAKKGDRGRRSIEEKIGGVLARTGKVDLDEPEVTIRVLEGGQWHLCRMISKVGRSEFERRKAENRPYVKPISLHPRFARALVNLSRIGWGGTLLDPFCGTGGILLEASLSGARVIGSDIDTEMIAGSRKVMRHFRQKARLIKADIGELPQIVGQVDAIATDPPYGRASSTKREPIDSLYTRAFEAFEKLLKLDARLAICLPDMKYADLAGPRLRLEEQHELRVHGSLNRNFLVFSRVH